MTGISSMTDDQLQQAIEAARRTSRLALACAAPIFDPEADTLTALLEESRRRLYGDVEPDPRYFVARSGRAFSCDGPRAGYIAKVVTEGGEDYVLAWDSAAGHYAARHSLTRRQQARIIREARPGPDPIDEPEAWS